MLRARAVTVAFRLASALHCIALRCSAVQCIALHCITAARPTVAPTGQSRDERRGATWPRRRTSRRSFAAFSLTQSAAALRAAGAADAAVVATQRARLRRKSSPSHSHSDDGDSDGGRWAAVTPFVIPSHTIARRPTRSRRPWLWVFRFVSFRFVSFRSVPFRSVLFCSVYATPCPADRYRDGC